MIVGVESRATNDPAVRIAKIIVSPKYFFENLPFALSFTAIIPPTIRIIPYIMEMMVGFLS